MWIWKTVKGFEVIEHNWVETYLFHITDSSLTECLTKINRMDIVHLMESNVETSHNHGRTYAEIEQTIGLDHSEGKDELTHTSPHPIIQ